MTLIQCKECKEQISDQADPCPRCGVKNPTMPYELERLHHDLEELKKEEKRQEALYSEYYSKMEQNIFLALFRKDHNRKLKEKVDEHVALAKRTNHLVLEKQNEISAFERKLREDRTISRL